MTKALADWRDWRYCTRHRCFYVDVCRFCQDAAWLMLIANGELKLAQDRLNAALRSKRVPDAR